MTSRIFPAVLCVVVTSELISGVATVASAADTRSRGLRDACWSTPKNRSNLQEPVVEMRVGVDEHGVVRNVRSANRVPSDPVARAVFETSRRRLLEPQCSPVPADFGPRPGTVVLRFGPNGFVE